MALAQRIGLKKIGNAKNTVVMVAKTSRNV
jgi:hypothetical protein